MVLVKIPTANAMLIKNPTSTSVTATIAGIGASEVSSRRCKKE